MAAAVAERLQDVLQHAIDSKQGGMQAHKTVDGFATYRVNMTILKTKISCGKLL